MVDPDILVLFGHVIDSDIAMSTLMQRKVLCTAVPFTLVGNILDMSQTCPLEDNGLAIFFSTHST